MEDFKGSEWFDKTAMFYLSSMTTQTLINHMRTPQHDSLLVTTSPKPLNGL